MKEFTKEDEEKMMKEIEQVKRGKGGALIIGFMNMTNFMKHYGETNDTALFNLKKEDESNLSERHLILQRIKKA